MPTGMTMNSWKSTLVSACAPPLRMFIIGTGSVGPPARAACGHERRQVLVERHACRRRPRRAPAAIDTPSTALAPRRPRFGVPSSAIIVASTARWSAGLARERRRDLAVDVPDGLEHALAEVALLVAIAEFERLARAGRGA